MTVILIGLFSYGARSFSIWNSSGELVYDSGSDFEDRLAELQGQGVDVWTDSRSDDKGPEPEAVIVSELAGYSLAFIGLERTSGVMVYDISTPDAPQYAGYINTKAAGDISPEGLLFVPIDAVSGFLVVTNEVSNTLSVYRVSVGDGGGSDGGADLPAPVVDGNTISWADNGWYQVQTADDFTSICEGGTSCVVAPGVYNVINLTLNQRWESLVVSGETGSAPTVNGNTISWADDGWYQVQTADTYQSVCEGGLSCEVSPGVYNVINLTTNQRYENIAVGSGTVVTEPTVVGNQILLPSDGWYQVQTSDTFESLCEGVLRCDVTPGRSYNVINLTTGQRFGIH